VPPPASEKTNRVTARFAPPFESDTDRALDAYAELSGLTVLRPWNVPQLPASLVTQMSARRNEAAALLEAELKNRNFEILRKDGLFALIVPVGFTNTPARELVESLTPPPRSPNSDAQLPAGVISFINVDVNQVLAIYAEVENRTILRPVTLPSPSMRLRTQTPLSKPQVAYVLKLLLAVNGIAVIEDGTSFLQTVPVFQASQIKPHAPKREEGDRLIDPKRVPRFTQSPVRPRIPARPSLPQAQLSNEVAKLYVEGRTKLGFPPKAPPKKPIARDLAEYYARLRGMTFIATNQLDNYPVIFALRTPVTKAELLYAIETTFELNNLALVPVGDKAIRVGQISERKPAAER